MEANTLAAASSAGGARELVEFIAAIDGDASVAIPGGESGAVGVLLAALRAAPPADAPLVARLADGVASAAGLRGAASATAAAARAVRAMPKALVGELAPVLEQLAAGQAVGVDGLDDAA